MTANDVVLSEPARQRLERRPEVLPSPVKVSLAPPGRGWRKNLAGARNVFALVLLAAVFTWRSAVSWRRWQQRRPRR